MRVRLEEEGGVFRPVGIVALQAPAFDDGFVGIAPCVLFTVVTEKAELLDSRLKETASIGVA